MAFRREAELRRGTKGGALGLGAHEGIAGGADAGEGRARGTKKGRLAALREFGGSSEYREWIRGTATGDCVVSMVVDRYRHWDGLRWDDKLLACATW